ncbi:LPS chain length-determining protein [Vibrio sp. JPW-9-11-11]|uniref:LPS O-antigen chain length determinant protein WzzB n=1 Tax=Vibrio sp. JPW-9-11-11 TaxID=1416532 RepID=UPI001592CA61|nr:LPS chain length-determining protein [Vibrio sp. JPW-9-11-11]
MSGQNQPPLTQTSYPPQVPSAFQQSDEIDLRELFKALWDGKVTIILATFVFAVGAVIYALTAQEWWSSKAKIAQAQPQDIAAYQQQVKQFQPVFDVYQEDGTVLVSKELDDLIDTEVLFQRLVDTFTSSNNKRAFLDASEEFTVFKAELELSSDTDSDAAKEAERKLYSEWFEKISASVVDKKAEISPYDISFQATTKQSSARLLTDYMQVITAKAHSDALNNLQAMIDGKRNELVQQKRILESQAKNRIQVEAEKAQYAYAIAKAAGVDTPIQTNGDSEIFAIDMGTKALEAKVAALQSLKNLSVVEPRLQQINAKLDMLANLKVDRNIQFNTFRYLEDIEAPISRDKPKRALIAVLGTLLGGMLGVAIVLVRFAFRREDD